jgi:CTP:molybdopterin cytidylyltransferase MocA
MADTNNRLITVPAVVLAGGTNDEAMRAATGVENRAMVELTPGRTMLDYVLNAAVQAKTISKLIVAGDVPESPKYQRLQPAPSFLENLIQGVAALPNETQRVLIVTSDIPFITAEAIDDFVGSAIKSGADLCYPIIPMKLYREEFAGLKRTVLKLAEGEFTGGNIMLMSCAYVREHEQTILQAYSARKDVFRLGKMLGWGLLLKIVISQTIAPNLLNISSLERGVSNLLGHSSTAKAIKTNYPSLGTDIDKPDDVVQARKIFETRI